MNKPLLRSFVTSLTFIILMVGCAKPPPNSKPEDTVMGSSSRRADYVAGKTRASGDYIDETLIYSGSSNDEPLMPRSAKGSDAKSTQAQNAFTAIYFGFDRSNIDAQERTKLLQVADHLNKNTQDMVLIKGHCDYFGTKEYNLALGERRALSAKRYLEQLGIASSRIETVSMGNLEAQYRGSKEEVAKDRRDDLFILN